MNEETGMHRGLKKHEWTYEVHSSGELIAVSFYDLADATSFQTLPYASICSFFTD